MATTKPMRVCMHVYTSCLVCWHMQLISIYIDRKVDIKVLIYHSRSLINVKLYHVSAILQLISMQK